MTVLVVADGVVVSELVQDALEVAGHACLIANDVSKAEWLLQTAKIDAVALDLDLPGRRPLDWLEEVHLTDPGLGRRSVVLTVHRLESEEVRRIGACGARILQKPCGVEQLRDAIIQRAAPIDDRLANLPRRDAAARRAPGS